jgi:hypothetical protein
LNNPPDVFARMRRFRSMDYLVGGQVDNSNLGGHRSFQFETGQRDAMFTFDA